MNIIRHPNPILNNPVDKSAIRFNKAESIFDHLCATLATRPNGVAIAANQAGLDADMFVYLDDNGNPTGVVNPVLNRASKGTDLFQEGCLSLVEGKSYKVRRHYKVEVNYMEFPSWKLRKGWINGFQARIFQHEMDHLQGIVLTDHDIH